VGTQARHHPLLLQECRASLRWEGGWRSEETGSKSFGGKIGVDDEGRRYQDELVKATGKYYRYYLDEPKIPEDWWADINSLQPGSAERSAIPRKSQKLCSPELLRQAAPLMASCLIRSALWNHYRSIGATESVVHPS
jgi:hypothetical protein